MTACTLLFPRVEEYYAKNGYFFFCKLKIKTSEDYITL